MESTDLSEAVRELLRGSVDLHVHCGPEPGRQRRMDALETGRHAYEAEMGGFVLKSHAYPTAPTADVLSRMYPGLRVYGSVTLNPPVGGLNPSAVEAAARMGAKIVWMPTEGGLPWPTTGDASSRSSTTSWTPLRPAAWFWPPATPRPPRPSPYSERPPPGACAA